MSFFTVSLRIGRSLCVAAVLLGLASNAFAVTSTTHSKHAKKAATTTTTTHASKKAKRSSKRKNVAAAPVLAINTNMQQGIDRILASYPNISAGVVVQAADTGATLYQHDANHVFLPASTLKVFTAVAALSILGPDYQFPTQFLTDNAGNLYAKFSGDPQLMVQDLQNMVATLSREGIQQIQGKLIIDDTAMDRENLGPGWMWDEQNFCYAAPSTAVIINRNCFGLNIAPGAREGDYARVSISQTLAKISITNKLITQTAYTWQCPLTLKGCLNNNYTLSGCIGPRHAPMSTGISLNDPSAAGADTVSALLKQRGISVVGGVTFGKAPADAKVVAEHDSKPLSALVTRMLKKSDNLIADSLFKKVGGAYYNSTGTWRNGAQAVRAILSSKAGVDFSKIIVVDGAGLSRYDLLSPMQFAKVLHYAYRTLPANQVFFQALPNSGIDGTIRGRMGGATAGKVHAKTGTMESTSGLAGYVLGPNNKNYIFVILVNGYIGKPVAAHGLQDRICQFLALNNMNPTPIPVTPAPAGTVTTPTAPITPATPTPATTPAVTVPTTAPATTPAVTPAKPTKPA